MVLTKNSHKHVMKSFIKESPFTLRALVFLCFFYFNRMCNIIIKIFINIISMIARKQSELA